MEMVVEGYEEREEEDSVEEKVATKQFAIPETEGHRCTLNNLLVFSKQDPRNTELGTWTWPKEHLCVFRGKDLGGSEQG